MPEFVFPNLPEIKNEITIKEFVHAIEGKLLVQNDWLFSKKGIDIKKEARFATISTKLNDEIDYVVLIESQILVTVDNEQIVLDGIKSSLKKKSILFYKSIIPGICLQKCNIDKLLFYESWLKKDIIIDDNTECEAIWLNNSIAESITINNSNCVNFLASSNSYLRDVWITNQSKLNNVGIINCKCGFIGVQNLSQVGNINIQSNSTVGNIEFTMRCQSSNIAIWKNSSCKNITITDDSKSGEIRVSTNGKTGNILVGNKSCCKNILIGNKSLVRNIWVENFSQIGGIRISNNSQIEDLYIEHKSGVGNIQIKNSTSKQILAYDSYLSLYLYNAVILLIKITKCDINRLKYHAGTKSEMYIEGSNINFLELSKTNLTRETVFSVIDSKIHIIQLQELSIQGQLILRKISSLENPFSWKYPIEEPINENIDPTTLTLGKEIYEARKIFIDQQEKEFYRQVNNIKKLFGHKPLFLIINSSLGKSEITGSDLRTFKFRYRDSKLLEMFFSGTYLPKNNIGIYNNRIRRIEESDKREQKISIYNQLKKICENHGNVVEAAWYHFKAMDNQEKLLKLKYSEITKKGIRKCFSDEAFDLFNFRLNKTSNNHGESWRVALVFFTITSFFSYSLYYISINYGHHFSIIEFGDFIGDYFTFLNPAHKIDFTISSENKLNAFTKFLDFFGRILISYGIYQFIAAFRRHGRKSF
jgi:hypothetical protein